MSISLWKLPALSGLLISSFIWTLTASAQHLLGDREDVPALVADEIIINYAHTGWSTDRVSYKLTRDEARFAIDGRLLDQELTSALLASLSGLYGSARSQSCADHSDDYPEFTLKIRARGQLIAELSSSSNCPQHIPWNVVYRGRLMAQYNGSIWRALHRLLIAIDASTWRGRAPKSSREASFDLRAGPPPPREIKVAQPIDASLRSALMAHPTFQRTFGSASPQIISAECKIESASDCAQLRTRFSVAFGEGFRLEGRATINATGVTAWELPSGEASQTARDLTQSALMKAYSGLSTDAPITVRYLQKERGKSFEWAARAVGISGDLSALRREALFISVASKSGRALPSVFFFPELHIGWIRRGESALTRAWLNKLGASPQAIEALNQGSQHLFVRLDGSIIRPSP